MENISSTLARDRDMCAPFNDKGTRMPSVLEVRLSILRAHHPEMRHLDCENQALNRQNKHFQNDGQISKVGQVDS